MPDLEDAFRETVRETLAALQARGKPMDRWNSSDGKTIVGWRLGFDTSYGPTIKGNPAADGGKRSGAALATSSDKTASSTITASAASKAATTLHSDDGNHQTVIPGGRAGWIHGKPFSKMKAMLERLPYL